MPPKKYAPLKKAKSTHPSNGVLISQQHTRSMTTDASRTAVLHTTELLENILLCLPARDLFRVQRVCQRFRDTISDSVAIQQKLFFRLVERDDKLWEIRKRGSDRTIVPLSPLTVRLPWKLYRDVAHLKPAKLNPLLSKGRKINIKSRFIIFDELASFGKPWCATNQNKRARASCLDTYLTDPPTKAVTVRCTWQTDDTTALVQNGLFLRDIEEKNGVMMKHVVAKLFDKTSEIVFIGREPMQDVQVKTLYDLCKLFKGALEIDLEEILILRDVYIPSDEEWRTVK